jgi:ESS family glutamate:Na+ symporter
LLELDAVETLAFGGLALLLGVGARRVLPVLDRYNIPTAVVGGLLVALAITMARHYDVTPVKFDTALQSP